MVVACTDKTPNDKPYELRYEDGERWRFRDQKEFSLPVAIQVADDQAGRGTQLYVVDPETEVVLWVGTRVTR
jgi:hypothetical protein